MKPNFSHTQLRIRKRLGLCLSYCLSLASVLAISAEAIAMPVSPNATHLQNDLAHTQSQTAQSQTTQSQTAQAPIPEASPTAAESAELRLQPFYNLTHTEGAGQEGFTSVGGFFPLFQTPGQNVTFIDGRVSVDNDGNFGGGLQAGYRSLLNDSTIWGAYAGFDVRDTGDNTFTQADVGTELLGENWDLTLNANLPLGNARQVVSSNNQAVNPRFVQNQLILDEQRVDQIQAALTTVSLDSGLQLFDWGSEGELWGRGGVYYLGGEASQESLGLRASLDYRLKNNLRFGLGVQNDGVFGTNAIFSVNAFFGGPTRQSSYTEDNSSANLWARAGEPIARTHTILIENQTDVVAQAGIAAINPDTDRAFFFQHVDPALRSAIDAGAVNADGTFEAPLGTIADAANIATANADNIIYVQEGNAGGDFTLPDGVQVRSVGPTQLLNTQFGVVTLPGSGSGNLPTLDGTATIGNNTLVSGLAIDPGGVDGIVATGSGIVIEENAITNARRGINLRETGGAVTIARNQISDIARDGIFFNDVNQTANTTITVANNTLADITGDGIEFKEIEDSTTANITVANNQITNTQKDSIRFDDIQGNAVATIDVSGNVINDAGNDGIDFDFIQESANATITVSDNQVINTFFEGIDFNDIEADAVATITIADNEVVSTETAIAVSNIEDNANATVTVTGNTVTAGGTGNSTKREGIFFDDIRGDAVANITIAENNILGAESQGIEFDFITDSAEATINVLNNQVSNVGAEGIFFDDIEQDATAVITVTGNTITNAGNDGIELDLIENNANVTATVTDNTITNPGGDGVRIDHTAATDFCLDLNNNTVTTPSSDGFEFTSAGAGEFQVLNLDNVTTANVGTFNPADIAANAAFVEGTEGVAPCP